MMHLSLGVRPHHSGPQSYPLDTVQVKKNLLKDQNSVSLYYIPALKKFQIGFRTKWY